MRKKRLLSIFLAIAMLAGMLSISVSAYAAETNPYEEAAKELDQTAYTGDDLGAVYTPSATTFKVWSPTATDVKVQLYATGSDKEEGAAKLDSHQMTFTAADGLWSATVNEDLKNVYYTYVITFEDGTVKEVVDVYAKAVGVNGDRGMVVDLSSTNPEGWKSGSYARAEFQTDAMVWELHVKDFSNADNSGISEENQGKYLAFTETGTTVNGEGKYATGIDYLKELGVNYVQLNPFYDYGSVDETGADTQFNWGYDPKNYNVPEGSYSSNPYDGNVRIEETKAMIQALHDAGIGVIMDVVYNHTYVQDSWLQQTVPNYYYRLNADGTWSNGSGCGNDTASERAMYRKYMIDSTKYWVEEYNIDGFRFDLMGLHDAETMNQIRATLDEIDENIIMYGEGWTMASTFDQGAVAATQANSKSLDNRIAFFNDEIRDGLKGSVFNSTDKGFVQGKTSATGAIVNGIKANTVAGNWKAQNTTQTVTYASCHDNHTLYDRLVESVKGAAEDNFKTRYNDLLDMNKMSAAITFTSQGSAFILAGEEFARTKLGDHNSYKSAASINELDWERTVEYQDLVSYYQGLMELRDTYDLFRDPTTGTVGNMEFYSSTGGFVAYSISDSTANWKNVAVAFNATAEDKEFTLPDTLPSNWVVLVNGDLAGVMNLDEISGNKITVPAGESLVIVDKDSYEASGVTSDKGIIKVTHINSETDEVISEMTFSKPVGSNYVTTADSSLGVEYDIDKIEGEAEGTVAAGTTEVTYYYSEYLLKLADVNGDGDCNLKDIMDMQRHVAYIKLLTGEGLKNADIDKNGVVNMRDILTYQKLLAYYKISGVGTLTVNYIDNATGEVIRTDVTKQRVGTEYSTKPANINFYVADETKLPKNAEGKYSVGNTTVKYYYNKQSTPMTVNVKLMDGQTWVPNLYAWDDGAGEFLGTWAGTPMTLGDDGWYSITFDTGGSYKFIINNGSNQTDDSIVYTSNIWVVMNTELAERGEGAYTVYTEKP